MMTMKTKEYGISRTCLLALIPFLLSVHSVRASAAANDQSARSVFSSTCASCHGQNGAPTAVGKSLNAPELGSADVQSHTNAQLQQIISGGKGNMPPFKGTLSESQISSLVVYVRTFSRQRKGP